MDAKQITAAIEVLKAAIADDYAMIQIENKYGRGSMVGGEHRRKVMCEIALDILCGEQPIQDEPKMPSEALRMCDRMGL